MSHDDLFGVKVRNESSAYVAKEIYSVSALNSAIRDLLEGQFFYCLVDGEISNAAFPGSGHIYFNLKDDGAVIRAVLWRSQAVMFRALIANGQKVRVTGKISVYAPRGEYQLVVNRVEEAGKGDLYLQYEALKKKLMMEGLFDIASKKPIPRHPRKIGLITSKTAAALQDVLNVLATHRPDINIQLYPTKVQGIDAGIEIAQAIERANIAASCDLLLVIRGGGSIEDLWAFNEEIVARAIYASKIPIITGVGHETDTTIADFVADLRAPTPSMAAKYSSQSRDELYQQLSEYEERLVNLVKRKLEVHARQYLVMSHRLKMKEPKLRLSNFQRDLDALKNRLNAKMASYLANSQQNIAQLTKRLNIVDIERIYHDRAQALDLIEKRLIDVIKHRQANISSQFVSSVDKLNLLSPLNTLLRGYSMATKEDGTVVKSIQQLQEKEVVRVKLSDGIFDAKVTKLQSDP